MPSTLLKRGIASVAKSTLCHHPVLRPQTHPMESGSECSKRTGNEKPRLGAEPGLGLTTERWLLLLTIRAIR
jgi:hypothetical protein